MTDSFSLSLSVVTVVTRPVSVTTAAGWKPAASVPFSKRVSMGKKKHTALIKNRRRRDERL